MNVFLKIQEKTNIKFIVHFCDSWKTPCSLHPWLITAKLIVRSNLVKNVSTINVIYVDYAIRLTKSTKYTSLYGVCFAFTSSINLIISENNSNVLLVQKLNTACCRQIGKIIASKQKFRCLAWLSIVYLAQIFLSNPILGIDFKITKLPTLFIVIRGILFVRVVWG